MYNNLQYGIIYRSLFSSLEPLPGLCYFTQVHSRLLFPTIYLATFLSFLDPVLKGSDHHIVSCQNVASGSCGEWWWRLCGPVMSWWFLLMPGSLALPRATLTPVMRGYALCEDSHLCFPRDKLWMSSCLDNGWGVCDVSSYWKTEDKVVVWQA